MLSDGQHRLFTAREWLTSARTGYCTETQDGDVGDCDLGDYGAFGLQRNETSSWDVAAAACRRKCSGCARCNYISLALTTLDCSWYHCCDLNSLKTSSKSHTGVPQGRDTHRSGLLRVARGGRDRAYASVDESSADAVADALLKKDAPPTPMPTPTPCAAADESVAADARLSAAPRAGFRRRRLLLLGVISGPSNFDRRAWLRKHYGAMGALGVRVEFVLGAGCPRDGDDGLLVEAEARRYGDVTVLDAPDCSVTAVAQKTLAWYALASRPRRLGANLTASRRPHAWYAWIGKTDDDSLIDLRKLSAEILAAERTALAAGAYDRSRLGAERLAAGTKCAGAERRAGPEPRPGLHGYLGTMRWRLWDVRARGGCGAFVQKPAQHTPDASLRCAAEGRPPRCVGPFPYADGAMHAMTRRLATRVFHGELARSFARPASARGCAPPPARGRRWAPQPARWTHEDVGVGLLLFEASARQRLPTFYFGSPPPKDPAPSTARCARLPSTSPPPPPAAGLAHGYHSQPWLDLREGEAAHPDGNVIHIHKVQNSMKAELAAELMGRHAPVNASFQCALCAAEQGWRWRGCSDDEPLLRGLAPRQLPLTCCQHRLA